MKNFIELENGDIININNILYVHPSKTEENAYIYLHGLHHSSDLTGAKMITCTLEDYDHIRKSLLGKNESYKKYKNVIS